jgi:hypothetical protein
MMLETQVPLRELEQLYTLRKPDEVIKFIGDNAFLIPLLRNAPEQIRQYFPSTRLVLELFVDYGNLSNRYLLILIQSRYSTAETNQRLDQLLDNWWLEAMYDSNSKLSINLEYL